jgi:hypothetical protein
MFLPSHVAARADFNGIEPAGKEVVHPTALSFILRWSGALLTYGTRRHNAARMYPRPVNPEDAAQQDVSFVAGLARGLCLPILRRLVGHEDDRHFLVGEHGLRPRRSACLFYVLTAVLEKKRMLLLNILASSMVHACLCE